MSKASVLPVPAASSRWCRGLLAVFIAGWAVFASAGAQPDGALDGRFNHGTGASDDVLTMAGLPGGDLLLGGFFTAFDGSERWRMARRRADGTVEPSFDPGDSSPFAPVEQLAVLPDGKILAAGSFTRFAGWPRPVVVRLAADGKVDAAFDASPAFAELNAQVNALAVLPDGKLLVGGRFEASAASRRKTRAFLVRLQPDGTPDPPFACEPQPTDREDALTALTVAADGSLLIGTHTGVVRLRAGGARDPSFQLAKQEGAVSALAEQRNGRILAAFHLPSGGWKLVRLDREGIPDPTFHPVESKGEAAGRIAAVCVQADDKILLGGSFHEVAGKLRHGLARLNNDGSLDLSFDPGTGVEVIPLDEADETPEAVVRTMCLLPEGGLLVAGRFDLYNGTVCHNIAHLLNAAAMDGKTQSASKP